MIATYQKGFVGLRSLGSRKKIRHYWSGDGFDLRGEQQTLCGIRERGAYITPRSSHPDQRDCAKCKRVGGKAWAD